MQPERWDKIESLFHAALKRDPADRPVFLADNCEGDASLCSEVTSLLTALEGTDAFFDATASPIAAQMFGDTVGQTVGPYHVLSILGSGGMGTVYLAQDVRLGRKIALKILPPQFTNDRERLRRFQQEARAASALNHPNILTVYEIEQKSDLHYIATEFIEGTTLRQKMLQGPLNLNEALNVAIQIAAALDAAHSAGVAHRDIKPENVMVRSDGYVKVLDFGLAKLIEQSAVETKTEDQTGTHPGIVMGTPRYMSPEQARGLEVDSRTDIFSLGVIMYEMITGQPPFEGATPSDIIAALLKDDPAPLSTRTPEIPPDLNRVVTRALAKNCDERYQTVAELIADLSRLKETIQWNTKFAQPAASESSERVIGLETLTAANAFASTNPDPIELLKRGNPNTRRRVGVGLGTLVLIAVAAIAIVSLVQRRGTTSSSDQSPRSADRALTIRSGYITSARFAADGKSVIYSAAFDGKPVELFITDVQGSESRPIGIQSAALKDVSSTGEMAVLFNFELNWNDGQNGTLALIPPSGGEPRVLMDEIDEATFAPDGKSLAIVRADMGQHQLEYPAGEVLYKSSGWISYPRFSRPGDKIAFFEHPIGDNSGSLMVVDLHTKTATTVSSGWRALKGLAWSAKGDEIWFGGSRLGKKQNINAVSLSGSERLNIDEMASYAKLEDISAEGRLLISHGNTHSTMVQSNTPNSESFGTRFAWATSADVSADGMTLLFYEWGWESGDKLEMKSTYIRKVDGSDPVRLGEGRALALSADGLWALAVQENSPPQLALFSTSERNARTLPNPGFREYHYASWFPDGRKILFTAVEAREDSFIRSFVQDLETGNVEPLTEEGTIAIRISPDGKKVVTRDAYGTYYIKAIDGGTSDTVIKGLKKTDEPIQWSMDGRALYVREAGDFTTSVYRVDLSSGRRRMWQQIVPSNGVGLVGIEAKPGGVIITPDGKVSVYTYWTTLHELLLMDHLGRSN